jgi:hypothetical protein
MSKKSRRRNKILGALALGIGASKLGMLGGKTASGIAGDKMASARKAMTSDVAMRGKTPSLPIAKPEVTKAFPKKVGKDVISSGPFKMFGAGKKTVGGKKFSQESIDKFKAANEAQIQRRKNMSGSMKKVSEGPSLFGFRFEKPLFKSGGSVMAKCKLGRNKKTKIY